MSSIPSAPSASATTSTPTFSAPRITRNISRRSGGARIDRMRLKADPARWATDDERDSRHRDHGGRRSPRAPATARSSSSASACRRSPAFSPRATHAPSLTPLLEIGVVNMRPDRHAGRPRRFAHLLSRDLLERLSRRHGDESPSRRGRHGLSRRARGRPLRQHQHDAVEGRAARCAISTAARAATTSPRSPSA